MADDAFRFLDGLGPRKILHVANADLGLKAIVVVDNTAAGPAIGGTRMAPDVDLEEAARLARAMTLKNAMAGLRHGGAKSAIIGDPAMPAADKERLIRAFAAAIADLTDYIPGPDMGTDETAMAWIFDETGRAVGLPRALGGIPLDEIGATGFGLAIAAEAVEAAGGPRLSGARVVVQGFGAVGRNAARFLAARGAMLVGVSDSRGAVVAAEGLDIAALDAAKAAGRPVTESGQGRSVAPADLVAVACDIWIPAARPDALTERNVDRLDCRLVLQGANIPATPAAEARLHARGILSIPDFIANAGGVICAAVEHQGGTEAAAMALIGDRLRANTAAVVERARVDGLSPRAAAVRIAESRVRAAMALRRWR